MQKMFTRVHKPLLNYFLRCLQDNLPFFWGGGATFRKLCAVSGDLKSMYLI